MVLTQVSIIVIVNGTIYKVGHLSEGNVKRFIDERRFMPRVKTAISLDAGLLVKVTQLANDLHISRSKFFTLAVQDYLKKLENQSLLAHLNEAYEDFPGEEEKGILKSMGIKQNKMMEQEPWK
jgi:hypothetical protein